MTFWEVLHVHVGQSTIEDCKIRVSTGLNLLMIVKPLKSAISSMPCNLMILASIVFKIYVLFVIVSYLNKPYFVCSTAETFFVDVFYP